MNGLNGMNGSKSLEEIKEGKIQEPEADGDVPDPIQIPMDFQLAYEMERRKNLEFYNRISQMEVEREIILIRYKELMTYNRELEAKLEEKESKVVAHHPV